MGNDTAVRFYKGRPGANRPPCDDIVTDSHVGTFWEDHQPLAYVCKVRKLKRGELWIDPTGDLTLNRHNASELFDILDCIRNQFARLRKVPRSDVRQAPPSCMPRVVGDEIRVRLSADEWVDPKWGLVVSEKNSLDLFQIAKGARDLFEKTDLLVPSKPPRREARRKSSANESSSHPRDSHESKPRRRKEWRRFRFTVRQITVAILVAVLLDCLVSLYAQWRDRQAPVQVFHYWEGRQYQRHDRF